MVAMLLEKMLEGECSPITVHMALRWMKAEGQGWLRPDGAHRALLFRVFGEAPSATCLE